MPRFLGLAEAGNRTEVTCESTQCFEFPAFLIYLWEFPGIIFMSDADAVCVERYTLLNSDMGYFRIQTFRIQSQTSLNSSSFLLHFPFSVSPLSSFFSFLPGMARKAPKHLCPFLQCCLGYFCPKLEKILFTLSCTPSLSQTFIFPKTPSPPFPKYLFIELHCYNGKNILTLIWKN